jgi:hypothetical protein
MRSIVWPWRISAINRAFRNVNSPEDAGTGERAEVTPRELNNTLRFWAYAFSGTSKTVIGETPTFACTDIASAGHTRI